MGPWRAGDDSLRVTKRSLTLPAGDRNVRRTAHAETEAQERAMVATDRDAGRVGPDPVRRGGKLPGAAVGPRPDRRRALAALDHPGPAHPDGQQADTPSARGRGSIPGQHPRAVD